MLTKWWQNEYSQADQKAKFSIDEPGITASHLEALTKYTESLRKPAETDSQKNIVMSLSVTAFIIVAVCAWIILNLQDKYDKGIQGLALTSAVSCISFLAGRSIK
jgi:hypothetical protein